MARILTVGHSNHDAPGFLELLRAAGVRRIVDVRSRPYSRYVPHARKRELEALLQRAGIDYAFAGDRLGGMPDNPDLIRADGRADYAAIAEQRWFRDAIDELVLDARESDDLCALLCAEENPARCHRRLLLTPALQARGIDVQHLRGTGELIDDPDLDRGEQLSLL